MPLKPAYGTRTFRVGDRFAVVSVAGLRADDGSKRFWIDWWPNRPLTMSEADVAAFDRGMAVAKPQLLADLGAST